MFPGSGDSVDKNAHATRAVIGVDIRGVTLVGHFSRNSGFGAVCLLFAIAESGQLREPPAMSDVDVNYCLRQPDRAVRGRSHRRRESANPDL